MENASVAYADMSGTHMRIERGILLPSVQLHSPSASGELNINPFEALSVNKEKAIKCFLLHWIFTLKGLYKCGSAIEKQKQKRLSKYCGWQWLSRGGRIKAWVQRPAVNRLCCVFILYNIRRALDLITGFCLWLFIIPCVAGDIFHKKQSTRCSPKKKKNQFRSRHVFLLSLVNTYPHYIPTSVLMQHPLSTRKAILHLWVISPVLLFFSPLKEGYIECIQKDVFLPPPCVSVPWLPIKLSHKSSIIGSKT